jgi:AhpD family alkylhydroperoxidase
MPDIIRGMSLVPDEMRFHIELEQVQYLPAGKIMDPLFEHHKGLTRAQDEIVAGRVSALNECFYWTSGHAMFLRKSGRATT